MDDQHLQRMADGATCRQAASSYRRLGWSVLALCPPDHVGIGRTVPGHSKICQSKGKCPWIRWKDFQDRLPLESEIASWWELVPNSNVGVALGPVSNLIRIDVEGAGGEEALLLKSKGVLPDTLEFRSGRADGTGRGLLYSIPPGAILRTTHGSYGKGQELRFQARGAQTVLPPSRHPSGSLYAWTPGHGPDDRKVTPAPPWLVHELSADTNPAIERRSNEDWNEIFHGSTEGSRNDNAASFIGKLLSAVRNLDSSSDLNAIWECAVAVNDRNDPPLDEAELRTIFLSILKKERYQRKEQEDKTLDAFVATEIRKSIDIATESPPPTTPPPDTSGLPDWHLVIVRADPVEYRLRSFWWADAPALQAKAGYLYLNSVQLLNWGPRGDCIRQAALHQADRIVAPTLKGWSLPGGHLEKLISCATIIEPTPESKRRLYVLGFVYRYLAGARPPQTNGTGDVHWPSTGQPTRCDDGSIAFKFCNLKRKIRDQKEDFGQRELTGILEDFGFTQSRIQNARWWVATLSVVGTIGNLSQEGESLQAAS